MATSVSLVSLMAVLAANQSSQLDCICSRIHDETAQWSDISDSRMWYISCTFFTYLLVERCETLEPPSAAVSAVARLVRWDSAWGPPPPGEGPGPSCGPPPAEGAGGGECDCGAALAAARGFTCWERSLACPAAGGPTLHDSAQRLNATQWTAETLSAAPLRRLAPWQSLRGVTRALHLVRRCVERPFTFTDGSQDGFTERLGRHADLWRRTAGLLRLVVTHLSQLFIPLAFEHVGNLTKGQQLDGWIKNMDRVRDMLDTKLRGVLHDVQFVSEQVAKYTTEEDRNRSGHHILRRPLLSGGLLWYQPALLSFRDDFGALCQQQLPQAPQAFRLADTLYSFYRLYFSIDWGSVYTKSGVDEEWQLEDQSNMTVRVDTGCLQLLADAVDHPRCPLEELPLDASTQRRQCRERLWQDLVERPPRPPVTSYLAYSERTSVSLCLLAWMAANSYGVCQVVPFSITQSVHDALCYFGSPHNRTCLQSNNTDAICSVSRAILLFKCRHFSSTKTPSSCFLFFDRNGNFSGIHKSAIIRRFFRAYAQPTETTWSYKASLNSVTLKYKDFKVDTLQALEYSFVAINVFFRSVTTAVYMWLPHLGNLPGKILLSFQLTGLAHVLFSEVVYRMLGFPDVSTAVLVDSCLTLFGCLWLNLFCRQLYTCVRDLKLPNHLTTAEASIVFRRQLRWALIPWAIVSTACTAMEKSSMHYLMHSRITLTVVISSSVAFNLVLLGLVAFIYVRNKKTMSRLNIIGGDKGFSKKQITFMSVNTTIFSGIWVIIRIGFQQAEGIAQYVYYVHIATMLQGPVLFIFLACNGKTLPALRNRVLALWKPDVYRPGMELGSAAERNLARRRGEPPLPAETAL